MTSAEANGSRRNVVLLVDADNARASKVDVVLDDHVEKAVTKVVASGSGSKQA